MGNDTVCKTVGIGNIRMRMFDGHIRTLTDVHHIPDLKKNLLSLGALKARGYKFLGADGRQENKICLLNKSLYVLKQSLKQWYKRFDSFIIKTRYNRCEYDSCVYFKQNNDLTYLLSYVDDMRIVAKKRHIFRSLKLSSKRNST